jgi:hypothetical protein
LSAEFEAARLQREDEHDRDVVLAYHIVHIYVKTQNDKRMPTLSTLLHGARRSSGRQSIAAQRSALQMLSQKYGIPLRQVH